MTDSTSGRTPSKRQNGKVRPKVTPTIRRTNKLSPGRVESVPQVNSALVDLLSEPETRLIMEADNVGLEELVATLTRIKIPRRRKH